MRLLYINEKNSSIPRTFLSNKRRVSDPNNCDFSVYLSRPNNQKGVGNKYRFNRASTVEKSFGSGRRRDFDQERM